MTKTKNDMAKKPIKSSASFLLFPVDEEAINARRKAVEIYPRSLIFTSVNAASKRPFGKGVVLLATWTCTISGFLSFKKRTYPFSCVDWKRLVAVEI